MIETVKDSYYNFVDEQSDIKSLIHLINLQGDNLVGLELGVYKGLSFCTILQNCPRVKELHGIDSWEPYVDYLKDVYDEKPVFEMDNKTIKHIRLTALHNIEFSGHQQKSIIHEKDSNDAVNDFEDESLDFIFMDTYMNLEQAKKDLNSWYPKVKKGGIFSGHDWNCNIIQNVVNDYRNKNNINSTLSVFDNTWVWKK